MKAFVLGHRFLLLCVGFLVVIAILSANAGALLALHAGDNLLAHLPDRAFIGSAYRSGALPLWNPYLYSGVDLPSLVQGGPFYPPNVVLYALLDPILAYNLILVGHLLASFLFTRSFLRANHVSEAGAILGGLIYTFTGFTSANIGVVPLLNAAAWVPAVFFLSTRWVQTRELRYCLGAGAMVSLQLLAGWPQMVVLTAIFLAIYFAVALPGVERKWNVAAGFVIIFLFSAAIALAQILPALELKGQSNLRGISFEHFVSNALAPQMLIQLVLPFFFGVDGIWAELRPYWGPNNFSMSQCYLGLLPLMFGTIALLEWRRVPLVRFGILAFIVSLILTSGAHTSLARLLYRVPIYNFFRDHVVNLIFSGFAIATLSAIGLTVFANPHLAATFRKKIALSVIGMFILVLAAALLFAGWDTDGLAQLSQRPLDASRRIADATGLRAPASAIPLVLLVAVSGLLLVGIRKAPSKRWRQMVLLFASMDLGLYAAMQYSGPAYAKPTSAERSVLEILQESVSADVERIYPAPGLPPFLSPNTNELVPLASILGFGSFLPFPYADLIQLNTGGTTLLWRELIFNNRILSLLNVRHLVLPKQPKRGASDAATI